ncbi:ABC transporter permease [Halodesulfovibrio marinisediminis]|uniref:Putative ABC transport system permease protein n=1 Tax=Halodesulfovibrio marinisediminis DSM 17456 TaxID=1121457 RepID=A0A1N6HI36_9BACT|nr:ABC transporter permease [Halodesulfovibrio marinisediminis]SIO19422.1 putative ABC transport system permease protein [Halodesulfovibrio marinisediminis DSM 17456]
MLNSLRIALRSLATHKLRSALAMLGVFLGTLALTGVLHVSEAFKAQAQVEIDKLGPNLLVALAGQPTFRRNGELRFGRVTTTFKMEDVDALLENNPYVKQGTPFVTKDSTITYRRNTVNSQLIAVNADFPAIRAAPVTLGSFFTKQDVEQRAKVCVLGFTIANKLFKHHTQALGKIVRYNLTNLRVIGVMPKRGRDLAGTDQDEQVYVPITTYMRRMSNQDWVSGVFMTMYSDKDEAAAKLTAIAIMVKQHKVKRKADEDFLIISPKDLSALKTQALQLVWLLGLMSSSISFSVGTMGVLSIMILLVQTRKMEIGIRRAIGARRSAIMTQFLLESSLLSGIGGTLGALVALVLITVIYYVAGFPYVYKPILIVGAAIGSCLLGVLAGAYPAWVASNIDVLSVLRDE